MYLWFQARDLGVVVEHDTESPRVTGAVSHQSPNRRTLYLMFYSVQGSYVKTISLCGQYQTEMGVGTGSAEMRTLKDDGGTVRGDENDRSMGRRPVLSRPNVCPTVKGSTQDRSTGTFPSRTLTQTKVDTDTRERERPGQRVNDFLSQLDLPESSRRSPT